jgi:type II secretory pathway pseudopilin PulG
MRVEGLMIMTQGTKQWRHEGPERACPCFGGSAPARRAGFSFTEILFAVMVLGVGFIMVAAIFPVAIQQSKMTVDETTVAAIARQATATLQSLAAGPNGNTLFPITGGVMTPIGPGHPAWAAVSGNLILSSDPRYAWVAYYRRDVDITNTPRPYMKVVIVGLEAKAREPYRAAVDLQELGGPGTGAHLQPRAITAELHAGGVLFDSSSPVVETIGEGAFVTVLGVASTNAASLVGQVARLGVRRADLDTGSGRAWELAPGNELTIPGAVTPPVGFGAGVLGRNWDGSTFSGPVQDVMAYVTYVRVN